VRFEQGDDAASLRAVIGEEGQEVQYQFPVTQEKLDERLSTAWPFERQLDLGLSEGRAESLFQDDDLTRPAPSLVLLALLLGDESATMRTREKVWNERHDSGLSQKALN
jgi:hypothetical protein